ncbi:MAG: hypothetical protein ACPGSI_05220 [Pikeienuella sp.]
MSDLRRWRKMLKDAFRLLESDRKLLLAGQISALVAQDARRVEVEARLADMPRAVIDAEQGIILEIQKLAQRNNRLLKAYLDGARAAMRRMSEIERNQGRIGAYQEDGSRVEAGTPSSTRQLRA